MNCVTVSVDREVALFVALKRSAVSPGPVSLFGPLRVFGPFDLTAVTWPWLNPHEENSPRNAPESRHQKPHEENAPINAAVRHHKSLKLRLARHNWSASAGRQRLGNRAMQSGRCFFSARSLAQRLSRRNAPRSPHCVCVAAQLDRAWLFRSQRQCWRAAPLHASRAGATLGTGKLP